MNTQPRALKWSIIIGIVIVLNLFFNYSLSLIYKSPEYEAYCPVSQVTPTLDTETQCLTVGGQWNPNTYNTPVKGEAIPAGYCNPDFTCQKNYDSAMNVYSRNVFAILIVLGVLSLLIGNFLKSNYVISQGLALGGVLSFIIASMRYWGRANDTIHVFILALALVLLFWIAYKKFKN
jgi:hypothetical protein